MRITIAVIVLLCLCACGKSSQGHAPSFLEGDTVVATGDLDSSSFECGFDVATDDVDEIVIDYFDESAVDTGDYIYSGDGGLSFEKDLSDGVVSLLDQGIESSEITDGIQSSNVDGMLNSSGTIAVSGVAPTTLILSDSITHILFDALQTPDSAGWHNCEDVHLDLRFVEEGWFHLGDDSCTNSLKNKWLVLNASSPLPNASLLVSATKWDADEYSKIRMRERGPVYMTFDARLNAFVRAWDENVLDFDRMRVGGEIEHWFGEHQE